MERALVRNGVTEGPRRYVEDDNSTPRVRDGPSLDSKVEPLDETRLGSLQVVEGRAADNLMGHRVRHAQEHLAAALVGERDAVADEILEVVAVLGFLAFEALVLACVEEPIQFVEVEVHATAVGLQQKTGTRLCLSYPIEEAARRGGAPAWTGRRRGVRPARGRPSPDRKAKGPAA